MSNEGDNGDSDDKGDGGLGAQEKTKLLSSDIELSPELLLEEDVFADMFFDELDPLGFPDFFADGDDELPDLVEVSRTNSELPEVYVDFDSKMFPPKFVALVWEANFTSMSESRLETYLQDHLDRLCFLMKDRVHDFFHGDKAIEEFNELEFLEEYERNEDILVTREALRNQLEVLIRAETKHLIEIDFLTYDLTAKAWHMVVLN